MFAFALLVPLTVAGLATVIIWVGLPILVLTLLIASGFAELSRARIRRGGGQVGAPHYRPAGRGVRGALRIIADPRRWLDLAFETLVALPMRLVTFVVAVAWTAVALGGLTYAALHVWDAWTVFTSPNAAVVSVIFLVFTYLGPGMIKTHLTLRTGNAWVHVWAYHALAPHTLVDTPHIVHAFGIR